VPGAEQRHRFGRAESPVGSLRRESQYRGQPRAKSIEEHPLPKLRIASLPVSIGARAAPFHSLDIQLSTPVVEPALTNLFGIENADLFALLLAAVWWR
jgi:hypothetical protein